MVAHILYNFNLEPVDELDNVKIMEDVLLRSSKTLQNNLIPAGSICNISIHNLHRTPEFCPNLDVFNPGRFLPKNIKERNLYSYSPFSAGPKNCIGQKFAVLRLKIIVAYILHNFYLKPVDKLDDVKMIGDFILGSPKPPRIKFISIK
ncbi:hypothetical protein HZH68_010316 [Vespula germanica]|uniref:Cytochrome P450 n=1 Tax=Vespula germanica TaxID=30212 RepID=A0A834N216_VESGE|nr:hypothetical protein HZH68_010316 [Vespula germanica]